MTERSSKTSSAERKPKVKASSAPSHPPGPASEECQAAKNQPATAVQPVEPENAQLTGASRAQQHQALRMNVEGNGGQAKPHPESTAGLHSTGSFTGKESVKPENVEDEKK